MRNSFRMVALLGAVALLSALGFLAAAQVPDAAILPMPGEMQVAETPQDTADVEPEFEEAMPDVDVEATEESPGAQPVEAGPEDTTEAGAGLPAVDPAWTAEEIAALRQMAQERIAAEHLMEQLGEYLHGLLSGGDQNRHQRHHGRHHTLPERDELVESVDAWFEANGLPESDELVERWSEVLEAITGSADIAVEDAKEIGRDWLAAQQEVLEELLEDVAELRDKFFASAFGQEVHEEGAGLS